MSKVEDRLRQHGHEIPKPPEAIGHYVPAIQTGNLAITSGQLPVSGKEVLFKGKVGRDLTEEEGCYAARLCALNALAQLKSLLGGLDHVKRIVRIEGYVQSGDKFSQQPAVINAASEIMFQAFGDAGKHTRIAVGVSELPANAAVELVVWAEV